MWKPREDRPAIQPSVAADCAKRHTARHVPGRPCLEIPPTLAAANGRQPRRVPPAPHGCLGTLAALDRWLTQNDPPLDNLWAALADEWRPADTDLPATGIPLELERHISAAFIRGEDYGTRASTIVAIDHAGRGFIHERRFGPQGVFNGETRMDL